MLPRAFALLAVGALLLPAAKKPTVATARGENQDLILTVTLHITPEAVHELLGSDLEGHYIVADVKVEPKYTKEITIDRDDFELRTEKDGEKARPFAPSQIAGRGALIVTQNGTGTMAGQRSPGWSLGGGGMMGGTSSGDTGTSKATMRNAARDKPNPIEKVLADRILPEKKTDAPLSGLLYFPMEQQKMKDLVLTYGGKENRITMRFK